MAAGKSTGSRLSPPVYLPLGVYIINYSCSFSRNNLGNTDQVCNLKRIYVDLENYYITNLEYRIIQLAGNLEATFNPQDHPGSKINQYYGSSIDDATYFNIKTDKVFYSASTVYIVRDYAGPSNVTASTLYVGYVVTVGDGSGVNMKVTLTATRIA